MAVFKWSQTPNERKLYNVDYSQWLSAGETINFVTVNVIPADPTTTALTVDSLAYSNDRTQISFFVSGGQDSAKYTVELLMNSTTGEIKDDYMIFAIKVPR